MQTEAPAKRHTSITVAWERIVRFVRQLSHDLRNDLNAAELQAAYLDEISTESEVKTEVRRLREMLARMACHLQKLSARVAQPQLNMIEYRASELLEDLRAKIERELGEEAAAIKWDIQSSDGVLNVDPQLFQEALLELFTNAFRHERETAEPVVATGKIDSGQFVLTLDEPKKRFDAQTENWGREPLGSASPGHYGVGLNRARVIVEAHGGELRAHHAREASVLRTTVTLPVIVKAAANMVK
jgi:two-component system, OmpR family, sensor histidine kinase KdpD